ncbi:TPA: hypothetical protein ACKQCJ_002014 [Stenotrophomonas maltophilia]|nr:hypothetical protein [Stenotrophomonas maltophilia]MBH1563718.1 hypothetical protein [Stenotrophomonas maltophilia]MBH1697307.1 hypothetical protein [Stenotrophomonas maltophilia]HEL3758914.1 hypothetical protein [Stenotrophomonas maltophilia]
MGSGKKQTVGYRYYMALYMGECLGPVDALREIRVGDRKVWDGSAQTAWTKVLGMNIPRTVPATGPITASRSITILAPEIFGGDKGEGGIVGTLEVRMGEPAQMPSTYLQSLVPGPWPAARGLFTTVFNGQVSAMNPYIKNWTKKVSRWRQGWKKGLWQGDLVQIDEGMNPAHIIYQVRTEGMGHPIDVINDESFRKAAQTLKNEGFGLCLKWSRSVPAGEFMDMVCDHIGGMRIEDPVTGLTELVLVRPDYDPATLEEIGPANIIELLEWQQPMLEGSVNEITVVYRDIATNKDAAVTYQNLASVQAQGRVVSSRKNYPGLWNAALAGRVAAREVAAVSSLPCRVKIRVRQDAGPFKRGQARALSWPRRGVARMPVRILDVDDGTQTDTSVVLTVAQDVAGMASASYIQPSENAWVEPDTKPKPVTVQRLQEASYRDLATTLGASELAAVSPDVGYLTSTGVRPTSVAFGYTLQTRLGSAPFAEAGAADFAPTGLLITAMTATTTAIALSAGVSLDMIEVGTEALIDDELVRVVSIDPVAATLAVARGCVDTVPMPHAVGTRVWFTDEYVGFDGREYLANESPQAKLITRTSQGELNPDLATTIGLTLQRRQIRPYPPGRLRVQGEAYPPELWTFGTELTVQWAHRDRILQADQLVDTTQGNIGPEPGTTYTVRWYLAGALVRTQAAISGTTDTYTPPAGSGGKQIRVEVEAIRDGYRSWQIQQHTFLYRAQLVTEAGDRLVTEAGDPLILE